MMDLLMSHRVGAIEAMCGFAQRSFVHCVRIDNTLMFEEPLSRIEHASIISFAL